MSEMIERVASVIFSGWEDVLTPAECRVIARAVIEAMRDPTQAMIDAPARLDNGDGCFIGEDITELVWRRMIDAALANPLPAGQG